jgi:hypothetical protein
MKNYYVYKITHIPTGKVYIGRKTSTPEKFEDYWGSSTHPLFASKSNKKVVDKYETFIEDNLEDYKKDVLEICSDTSVLGKRETHWIRYYKEKGLSVNKHDNYKFTTSGIKYEDLYDEKIREDIRQRRIDYNKSEEKRKELSDRMKKNNPMDNSESRKKVGEAARKRLKGKRNDTLISSAHTDEAKKKRSETMKRRTELGLNDKFINSTKGKDQSHFIYAVKGTIWINKEGKNKRINSDKLSDFEKEGWSKGRYVPKRSDSAK